MTVSLYTGHVGSGKSYEVVRSVIIPALQAGRTVVSNIEGLDRQEIAKYLDQKGCENPGHLEVVDKLELRRGDFFPERQKDGSYKPSPFVPLGALVVVDECPFYWGTDKSILPAHLAFFREHRHIVAADGTACDLVVVSQTVDSVHRSLKGLVEFSVDCRRLAALGLNKKYSTVTYEGARRSGKYVMGRETKTYDKAIFKLYKSFSQANGKIVKTDKRFTVWNSKLFWAAFAVAPVVFITLAWRLYRDFHPSLKSVDVPVSAAADNVQASSSLPPAAGGGSGASRPVPGAAARAGRVGIGGDTVGPVSVWRITGAVRTQGEQWVVIRRDGYPLRYLPARACILSFGNPISCTVNGEVIEPDNGQGGGAPGGSHVSNWAPDVKAAKVAERLGK